MGVRRLAAALSLAIIAAAAPGGAARADAARDAILTELAAQAKAADAAFQGFSAERGEALYRARHTGGDAETSACTTCHGENPAQAGENLKTGKRIEPMAVSANPARYTSAEDVEKWFRRNCKQVLGRECTPLEKGDFITYMIGQ